MFKIRTANMTAKLRRDTQQCEEIRGDLVTLHSLGHTLAGQIRVPPVKSREVLECLALFRPIEKVRGRRFDVRRILLGNGFIHNGHAIEIRKRKRPEQQGIDVAEHRCVRADAQRKREHRKGGETWALAHHAQAVKNVLK